MTNNDELALKLKAAAEKATPGRIGDRIDGSGSIKYECFGYDGSLVLKTDHKNMQYGFVGDNSDADELFFRMCVPDFILSLLAERDADKKSIEYLKEQLSMLANFNPDWDRLEATTDSLREHMTALTAAQKRIAELEARTMSVKLPKLKMLENYLAEVAEEERKQIIIGVRLEFHRLCKESADAAGIKLEVGE